MNRKVARRKIEDKGRIGTTDFGELESNAVTEAQRGTPRRRDDGKRYGRTSTRGNARTQRRNRSHRTINTDEYNSIPFSGETRFEMVRPFAHKYDTSRGSMRRIARTRGRDCGESENAKLRTLRGDRPRYSLERNSVTHTGRFGSDTPTPWQEANDGQAVEMVVRVVGSAGDDPSGRTSQIPGE